jgi:hypothetical protein
MKDLAFPPSRIALVGQSLGTAVLSGVVEQFLANTNELVPLNIKEDFAIVLLISGFTNLKELLLGYRMGGFIPILSPLAGVPGLQKALQRILVETWDSQKRLMSVVDGAFKNGAVDEGRKLNIQFAHAADDWDIPFKNSVSNYEALLSVGNANDGNAVLVAEGDVDEGEILRSAVWDGGKVKLGLRVVRLGGELMNPRFLFLTLQAITVYQLIPLLLSL